MTTFNPNLEGLAPTKRAVNRTKVNESQAGNLGGAIKKCLLLLPLQTTGSLSDADKIEGLNLDDVNTQFGNVAYLMARAFYNENPAADCDAIAVAEAATGVASVRSISFATAAAADGTAHVWLGDYIVDFDILKDDTATEIAAACIQAINDDAYAPFTAAVDGTHDYQVNLTYDFKGILGDMTPVEVVMPAGVATTATVGQVTVGSNDPDVDAGYTDKYKMTDYDEIGAPWPNDNIAKVADFMTNGEQGRGAMHFLSYVLSYADALQIFGSANRKDFTVLFMLDTMGWATPPNHRLAIEMGVVSAETNPNVPFQKEARPNVLRLPSFARPTSYDTMIEHCLAHGLSIDDIDGNTGDTRIERLISTKTKLTTGVVSEKLVCTLINVTPTAPG